MKNNNNNNIFLLLFHFSLEFWLYFEIVRIIYGNNQLHTWSSKGWIVKMQSRVTRIENLLIKKGTNELYRLFHSNSIQLLLRRAFVFKMPYARLFCICPIIYRFMTSVLTMKKVREMCLKHYCTSPGGTTPLTFTLTGSLKKSYAVWKCQGMPHSILQWISTLT